MQSINNFLSTASSFVSSSFHSISKGATLADLFSRAVRNPLIVGGVVMATSTSVVLCALKCKKVRAEKAKQAEITRIEKAKQDETRPVTWTFEKPIASVIESQDLKIEVESYTSTVRYYVNGHNSYFKFALPVVYNNGKYICTIPKNELKENETISFNVFDSEMKCLKKDGYFFLNIQKPKYQH